MANDVNRVSPSKYDIYEKLLDIAKNYTDTENTDYLKTGLFGYLTESMAMMMRDSSLQKAMLYNENNLNTAVIPSTVYNWAKMFNVDIARNNHNESSVFITITGNMSTLSLEVSLDSFNLNTRIYVCFQFTNVYLYRCINFHFI